MAKRGRAATRSVSDIDAQIADLEERKRELLAKEAERLRQCAERAGLISLSLSNEELEGAFCEIAKRFRPAQALPNSMPRKADRQARETASPRE